MKHTHILVSIHYALTMLPHFATAATAPSHTLYNLGGLGGASPRHISQRLSHLSTARHHPRVTLSAAAVTAWLTAHPAAAGGISTLSLDLSHHMGCHDFDTSSLEGLLQKLPQVTHVVLAGAVEGTDAYEPLGALLLLPGLIWFRLVCCCV